MKRTTSPVVFLPTLLLIACTAEPTDPGAAAPPTESNVVRPTQVGAVTLGLAEHALPTELANAPVSIGEHGAFTIVGGAGGLFALTSNGFEAADTAAVEAIVAFDGKLIVANANGLHLYGGTLEASPLNDPLSAVTVTDLATRGAQLWIGTTGGLYVFESGRLTLFTDTMSVAEVSTFTDAADVVVKTTAGAYQVLRLSGTDWQLQSLPEVDAAVPAANGRTIALDAGKLVERVADAGKFAWHPVAIDVAEDATGAEGIDALAVDPITGAVWALGASLVRIEASVGRLSTMARPSGLGSVLTAVVSSGGSLWTSDGVTLRRMGTAGEPVGFATHIAPFSEASCNGCHTMLGTAPMPLETYEEWVQFIDKSIVRLEDQTMPPAGTALMGGTADLARRWRDDGLRP